MLPDNPIPNRQPGSEVTSLVITCEHGGNRVPPSCRHLFNDCQTLLKTHRGFDPGALSMARALAKHFNAPLLTSTTSRLLVDLNRSIGHPDLHMKMIRELPASTRQKIVERHYQPYRIEADRMMANAVLSRGSVVHVSCHSFTENLDGVIRNVDIGLLYDPSRERESNLCAIWKSTLRAQAPHLTVRRNFPYQGRNDGLTSSLRDKFPTEAYTGIELEINQKHLVPPNRQWKSLRDLIIATLETALTDHTP